VIVTYNLTDFPKSIELQYDIKIQHPDIFLTDIYNLHSEKTRHALLKMAKRLKNPPKSPDQILDTLAKSDLKIITEILKKVV